MKNQTDAGKAGPETGGPGKRAAREQKLALALRRNLARRKSPVSKTPERKTGADS